MNGLYHLNSSGYKAAQTSAPLKYELQSNQKSLSQLCYKQLLILVQFYWFSSHGISLEKDDHQIVVCPLHFMS